MNSPLHLFEGYGIEIEYMIVGKDHLSVAPIADQLIFEVAGEYCNDVEFTHTDWSNELVLHLIEIKTHGPAKNLETIAPHFQDDVIKINKILEKYQARLLPTGIHPWMQPLKETKLWPHEYNEVYESYNRIFSCQGHGWSNVQSTHINLPFGNDEEFGRLHTAIRLLLPIMPALSASSPIVENKITGFLDNRLVFYRQNQQLIPSITGFIIPELVLSQAEYEEKILQPIYKDISKHDPEGILQYEWLNSRGAIARFDRNAIEIRILDTQENPAADLAIVYLIVAVLKALTFEEWTSFKLQKGFSEKHLGLLLQQVIQQGFSAMIDDAAYLSLFGYKNSTSCTVGDLWKHLWAKVSATASINPSIKNSIDLILNQGNLSQRILYKAVKENQLHPTTEIYQQLANCLEQGRMFDVSSHP